MRIVVNEQWRVYLDFGRAGSLNLQLYWTYHRLLHMRVAVKSHALPIYKKNRIASLLCIFETTIHVPLPYIKVPQKMSRLTAISDFASSKWNIASLDIACESSVSRQYTWNTNIKVSKGAKIRNRYNQVPHLTQDTNGKMTNSQLDTTNKSKAVSPFPADDHKAQINRRAQRHSKHKTEKNIKVIHKRSTAMERSVKYFTGGLIPV